MVFTGNARPQLFCACMYLLLLVFPHLAIADEGLWAELRQGGKVVIMRHAMTGKGDPFVFAQDDCSVQLNLSEAGRKQSRLVGKAFTSHGVPIGEVLASPYCRTLETARIAFGRVNPWQALDLIVGVSDEEKKSRSSAVEKRIASFYGEANLVMVTHKPNVTHLTLETIKPGEFLVLRPSHQHGFEVIGRILVRE